MRALFSLVGCGRIGTRHAEHMIRLGQLVAACDIDQCAAARFASVFPQVPVYLSIEELLARDTTSRVLSICTPNGYHAPHAILGLRSGKHVICEKPMALTSSEARQMMKAADLAHRRLIPVSQNRFNPPVMAVKRLLDDRVLGRILLAQVNCFWNRSERYYRESAWRGTKSLDGGILYTQFSHFIDLIHWFLGDVKRVSGFAENLNHQDTVEFEDTLVATIELESGTLVTLNCTINSHERNMEGSITLFGDQGTVKIGGQYLNVLEYQRIDRHVIEEAGACRPPNDFGFYQGSMSNHDLVIANAIDVLDGRAEPIADSHEGMKTVEMIERIYQGVIRKHDRGAGLLANMLGQV